MISTKTGFESDTVFKKQDRIGQQKAPSDDLWWPTPILRHKNEQEFLI